MKSPQGRTVWQWGRLGAHLSFAVNRMPLWSERVTPIRLLISASETPDPGGK